MNVPSALVQENVEKWRLEIQQFWNDIKKGGKKVTDLYRIEKY